MYDTKAVLSKSDACERACARARVLVFLCCYPIERIAKLCPALKLRRHKN